MLGWQIPVCPVTRWHARVVLVSLFAVAIGLLAGALSPAVASAQTPDEIFVADPVATNIFRVNPVTGSQTLITSGNHLTFPNGIAIDANGQLLVINLDPVLANRKVVRINPANGNQSVVTAGGNFSQQFGMALEADGSILIADASCCGGNGGVIRVNPTTGAQTVLSTGNNAGQGPLFGGPASVTVAANGNIYVLDNFCCTGLNGGVFLVNRSNGNRTLIAQGGNFGQPNGLVVGDDGQLYVSDRNCCGVGDAGVFRINPSNGSQSVVTTDDNLIDPYMFALARNGDLILADRSCCGGLNGGIVRINPSTGAQTVVSSGGSFLDPQAVAIAPVLTVSDISLTEGTGGTHDATFTLTLAPYTSQTVTVDFSTLAGSAAATADFTTRTGSVTFNPGERTKDVVITVISDSDVESAETFTLQLSNALAAILERTQALATIQDDDVVAPPGSALTPTPTPIPFAISSSDGPEKPNRPDKKDDQITEEQRQQKERTNRAGLTEYRTEGNVLAVERTEDGKALLVTIAMTRDETVVVLIACFGDGSCQNVQVGDYLEADGEQGGKDVQGRFIADSVTVTRGGKRVR